MPESSDPDWKQFYLNYVNFRKWDVIHFNYGRELMLHLDADEHPVEKFGNGTPRGD